MLPENFFTKLIEKDTLFKKGRAKGFSEGRAEVKAEVLKNIQKHMAQLSEKDELENELIHKLTIMSNKLNNL